MEVVGIKVEDFQNTQISRTHVTRTPIPRIEGLRNPAA